MSQQQTSYCLDVSVGYNEHYMDELLAFLQGTGDEFGITTVQRGRMNGVKILRILTTKAEELKEHIFHGVHTGDDNDYEVHSTAIDARRSMNFLADYGNPLGHEPFDIKNWTAPQQEQTVSRTVPGGMVPWDDDSIY